MKKLILSLVVAMALIGAVYGAAATLTVAGTDKLGSGTEVVTSGSVLATTGAEWVLDGTDNSKVNGVILKFDADVADGSKIDVQVRQISCTGNILGQGSLTLSGLLTSGTQTAEFVFTASADPAASEIDCLEVTVRQPA